MAMELHIFSDRRLASIHEWQRAIDAEGFPLRLSPDVQFDTASGFLPCRLSNKTTGFECYHDNAVELGALMSHTGRGWPFALGLRWTSDLTELQAAWMAASAYARATHGLVFDHQEGKAFTPAQAKEVTLGIERDLPKFEEAVKAVLKKIGVASGDSER
jgi:hypothetical protein